MNRFYYSAREASEYLGVSVRKLNQMRQAGKIHGIRLVRGFYYSRDDLDALLQKKPEPEPLKAPAAGFDESGLLEAVREKYHV